MTEARARLDGDDDDEAMPAASRNRGTKRKFEGEEAKEASGKEAKVRRLLPVRRALVRLDTDREPGLFIKDAEDLEHDDQEYEADVRAAARVLTEHRVTFSTKKVPGLIDKPFYNSIMDGYNGKYYDVDAIPLQGLLQVMFCDDLSYIDKKNAEREKADDLKGGPRRAPLPKLADPVDLIIVKVGSLRDLHRAFAGVDDDDGAGLNARRIGSIEFRTALRDGVTADDFNNEATGMHQTIKSCLQWPFANWYMSMLWLGIIAPERVLFQCATRGISSAGHSLEQDEADEFDATWREKGIRLDINIQDETTLAAYLKARWVDADEAALTGLVETFQDLGDETGAAHMPRVIAELMASLSVSGKKKSAGAAKRQLSLSSDDDEEMSADDAEGRKERGSKRKLSSSSSDSSQQPPPKKGKTGDRENTISLHEGSKWFELDGKKGKSAGAAGESKHQLSLSSDDDGDDDEAMPAAGSGESKRRGTKRKLSSDNGKEAKKTGSGIKEFKYKHQSLDPLEVVQDLLRMQLTRLLRDARSVKEGLSAEMTPARLDALQKASQAALADFTQWGSSEQSIDTGNGDSRLLILTADEMATEIGRRDVDNAIYALFPDHPPDRKAIRLQPVIAWCGTDFNKGTGKNIFKSPADLLRLGNACKRALDSLLAHETTVALIRVPLLMGDSYAWEHIITLRQAAELDAESRLADRAEPEPEPESTFSVDDDGESTDDEGKTKKAKKESRRYRSPLNATIAVWFADSTDKIDVFPAIRNRFLERYNIQLRFVYFPDAKYEKKYEIIRLQIGDAKESEDSPFKTVRVSEEVLADREKFRQLGLIMLPRDERTLMSNVPGGLTGEQHAYLRSDNARSERSDEVARLYKRVIPLSDEDQALLSGALNAAGAHQTENRPVSLVIVKASVHDLRGHALTHSSVTAIRRDKPYSLPLATAAASKTDKNRDVADFESDRELHDSLIGRTNFLVPDAIVHDIKNGWAEPDRFIFWRFDQTRESEKTAISDALDVLGVNVVFDEKGLRKVLRAKLKKHGMAVRDAVAAATRAVKSQQTFDEGGVLADLIAQFAVLGKKKLEKSAGERKKQLSLDSSDDDDDESTQSEGEKRRVRSQYEFVHQSDTDSEDDLTGTMVRGKHAVYHLRKLH